MPFFYFIVSETMGDKWATSGITTLIGLGMTFVILALLIGTILLMRPVLKELGIFNSKIKEQFKKLKSKIKSKKSVNSKPVDAEVPAEPEIRQQPIDNETYEAICSAVMNYTKKDDNVVIIKSVSRATSEQAPIEESSTADVPATPTAASLPTDDKQIKAPMPGTLLKIVATNGKQVKEGDVIFVLEAMKMENDIVSPATGTIQISIAEGAKVNTGDMLAVIK